MNVSLTPELEEYVAAKVKSGGYRSASEVLREALRLHEEQGRLRALRMKEIAQRLAEGVSHLQAGQRQPLDVSSIKAEGRKRRKAR